jgi:hypothetical protein
MVERVVVVFYAGDSTVSTRTFMLAENKKNKVVTSEQHEFEMK